MIKLIIHILIIKIFVYKITKHKDKILFVINILNN